MNEDPGDVFFEIDGVSIWTFSEKASLGAAAAGQSAAIIRHAILTRGRARILVATGNSQLEMMAALIHEEVDWSKVEAFHLDEYVGIPADHPASFRRWIRERFEERVRPAAMHYIQGDASDLAGELQRYTALLGSAPIDLAFVGFGENGHIAFNDPPVADFEDPLLIKRVTLDEACRRQQVGEGHFPDLAHVPTEAVTVTCSGLMRAKHWVCCVADARKAEAVHRALTGPIAPDCPAGLVRRHPSAFVYLDRHSATRILSDSGAVRV